MKKALSILLSGVLLMAVMIAVPFTASAATDREIDLSNSNLLTTNETTMTYEGGILKFTVANWYGAIANKQPIKDVGSISTTCKEIGLRDADNALVRLESGKKYAVTLNYKFVNNNNNNNKIGHLPQIAIGYDSTANASSTSAGNFYVAAVKNHVLTDKENSYYLSAVIEGKDKPLRIAFSGVWKFEINSILLQEIDATAENQVTVVYCDGGEYKAEFETEGGALKTPVKDGKAFAGWYLEPDFSGKKVTTASAGAVLYAKWVIKTDLNIDLSKSKLLITSDNTEMTYDTEGGILKLSAKQWHAADKVIIKDVGSKSTECKEIGLKNADDKWVWLESGKRYAVTLNYKFADNNGNSSSTAHLPQIAIGYDGNGSSTSKGAFYAAAVKNHASTDAGKSYYLNAEITGNGNPLRIGFSGVVKFEINSIFLQEIDTTAENQVTVVYCDGGEYKAEFETAGEALKTPVKDGMAFSGWYSEPDFSGAKVTAASAGAVLYAKWINPIEGDLNEDGVADIRDLVMLKEAAINQDTDMKYDLDGDSKPATEDDLLFLKKLLLGITV